MSMGSAGAKDPIRVGFIELPDEALDLLSEYTQRSDAEVSLVVGQDGESYALRMAEILQVPTLDRVNRLALMNCDRLVVGSRPPGLIHAVEEAVAGTRIRVVSVEEAMERSRTGDVDFLMHDRDELEPNPPDVQNAVRAILDTFDPEDPLGHGKEQADPVEPSDFVIERGVTSRKVTNPDGVWKPFEGDSDPFESMGSQDDSDPASKDTGSGASTAEAEPAAQPMGAGAVADASETATTFEEREEESDQSESGDYHPDLREVVANSAGGAGGGATPAREELNEGTDPPTVEAQEDTGPAPVEMHEDPTPAPEAPIKAANLAPDEKGHAANTPAGVPSRDTFPAEVAATHVLGEDLREELGQLLVDSNPDEVLARILEIAIRATGTQSGSIMLLDPDGANLRLVVAEGLPAELIARVRQAPGEGVAGEVLKTGKPRLLRGRSRLSPMHRRDVRPKLRESAVVPILSDGRPIGVISVNMESEQERLNEGTLNLLGRFAKEVSVAILKAVNLGPLTGERQRDALLRQVERLMALDESMPHRLRAVTEALRKAYRAEIAHLMMLDPLGRRLELMSPAQGLSLNRGEFLPLDRGLYGWVVRNAKPHAIQLSDPSSELNMGIMLLPIGNAPVRGLLVLENMPLPTAGPEEPLRHLSEIIEGVSEMIEVEKSLEAQELLSQLQIRVADQSSRFSGLLPLEQARAVLEFGIELLAAETAVFVPEPGGRAVWARPEGAAAAHLQAEIRGCLNPMVEWVLEHNRVAGGASLPGWDPDAPLCPAPYLGVAIGRQQGVLILVFSAQDQAGTLTQVPINIVLQVLSQLGELLPDEMNGGGAARVA